MSKREVRFLWAGLVVGFMLGAAVAVIVIVHMSGGWGGGVPTPVTR